MIEFGVIVALIIGLTELFKRVGFIPNKYLPLLTLALGIVAGVFYMDGDVKTNIFYGVAMGLSASGLFDQSKIVTKGVSK